MSPSTVWFLHWRKLMLACEARPGRMWLHEPMLGTVVSVPQPSNDCAFGSDFQNTPLKAGLYVCWALAGPLWGRLSLTKTWPALWGSEVQTSLSTVHKPNGLCVFFLVNICACMVGDIKWLCPVWLLFNVIDCWKSCWPLNEQQGWIGQQINERLHRAGRLPDTLQPWRNDKGGNTHTHQPTLHYNLHYITLNIMTNHGYKPMCIHF